MPKGVICLAPALAFHGLTDQMPPKVWIAIGRKDWRPRLTYPPIHIVRFSKELLGPLETVIAKKTKYPMGSAMRSQQTQRSSGNGVRLLITFPVQRLTSIKWWPTSGKD